MATNIEQIFRSFVVRKFREIQEQQFGSGKVGQQNGEINSSEQVDSADDTIASIGALQNDPLVQKIEQVLSEVLGAEPQYKPGAGQDTLKNKSRSTKRGIPDEVQDEIPRKKSKKDKKHKDKKKKKRKKEKKEKKYKKQPKESKINSDDKGHDDIHPASDFNPESSVLSAENMDVGPGSPLKHDTQWFMEKTMYENLNSSLSSSHNASNSDTSKLDASEEDSVVINIQELSEVEVTNERELESYTSQHTNLAVNLHVESEFSNSADTERDDTSIKETKQPEASLSLQTAENINVSENSLKFMTVELEDLETSVKSHSVEVKELDSLSESLDPGVTTQPESVSFIKAPLETTEEAKDSVTTLGFLAIVVGKDFEATSEFLNKAKVKPSERSPKDDAVSDMKDELEQDSERIGKIKDLEKSLQTQPRTEKKGLESFPKSVCTVTEKEDSERSTESNECKSIEASVDPETIRVIELKEIQTPETVVGLPDPLKYRKSLETDMGDAKRMADLEIMKRTHSGAYLLDSEVETKNSEAVAEETDVAFLRATSLHESEKEKLDSIPEAMGLKNLGSSPEFVGAIQVNYLEASLEAAVEKKGDTDVTEDSKMVVGVKDSENITRTETTLETLDIAKTQYLDLSKQVSLTDSESETDVILKDLKKVPEQPSETLKNLETISEMQHVTEMKLVKDVLQSDVVAQGKDSEINLIIKGQREERDLDAASESLHMIFTNYSEQSLELYTEPEAVMEFKTSERVPKTSPAIVVKDLKPIDSLAVVKLKDLEKNMEYLQSGMKKEIKSKAVTDVKYLETHVQSEAVTKEKDLNIISYSVTGVKEKVSDTVYVGKVQYGAETVETTAEVDIVPVSQELKETGGFIPVLEGGSPNKTSGVEMSALIDPKDASRLLKAVEDFESVSSHQLIENEQPLHFVKTKEEIKLGSQNALEVKYMSPKLLLSEELTDFQEKPKLEESMEGTSFTVALDSPYGSRVEPIVASESGETNEVIDSELQSLYMIHLKGSKTISESKIMDAKNLEIEPESSHRAGVETEDFSELESVVSSQVLEIIAESSKENEKQESSTALGIKALTVSCLNMDSETICVMDSDNSEIVEKTQVAPTSQVTLGMRSTEEMSVVSAVEYKDVQAPEIIETEAEVKRLPASTEPVGIVKGTFHPRLLTDTEHSEADQMLETNLESADKKELNTEFDHKAAPSDSEIFKKHKPLVGIGATESILPIVEKAEEKESGTDLKPEATRIEKYSESVCESVDVSESEHGDATLSVFMVDVKDTELSSDILEAGEVKALDMTLQFETTPEPLCLLELGDSDVVVESILTTEPKDLGETLNCEIVLEAKDPVSPATNLIPSELKSSESLHVLEMTNSEEILEITTPTYLSSVHLKSSEQMAEIEALDIIDSETPLKSEMEVKYFESVSESDCVLEPLDCKAGPESENISHEKMSKTPPEIVCMKPMGDLETTAEPKHAPKRKDLESLAQSVCPMQAICVEANVVYEEVQDVSETTPQFSGITKIGDLGDTVSSVAAEMGKTSDKKLQLRFEGKRSDISTEHTQLPDLMETYVDMEAVSRIEGKDSEPFAEKACVADKNSNANSVVMGVTELKDTAFVTSKTDPEPIHLKELEAIPKCDSPGKVKDLHIAPSSIDKGLLVLERQDLEKDSASVLESEVFSEESLKSVPTEKVEESEAALKYTNAKGVEISEQNTECICMGEMKALTSVPEHAELAQAKNSEMLSEVTLEVKSLEATLEPLCLKEKQLETTLVSLEEQILKTSLKPVCGAEKNKLETSQHMPVEVKDSDAVFGPKIIVQKDLEADSCASLQEQHLEAVPESSEIAKENDESISKDKKSEKVSSKSKDKSKSGKKAKKSRSKSPSKSKKRKKKSRSRSTSRQTSSRRARSRSKNDSDSRKKHSTSHRRSRSKSAERKESNERSLRSRRRRSWTSDHKSRSKSVDKRETSLRSRRRQSRSSDRRKSRSKSVDRWESVRTRRRLSRSSDNRRSRSKSYDKRETLTRSRRRLSRSSDHRKSRSRSTDRRETSVRTRRRRSRSLDNHKSRSRSIEKREASVRRRRRRSRSSDNYKSRSKSVDRRESSVRSRRRRSRSSDHHKSRSRSIDDKREISVRTRRKRSRSSENRRSRSKSVDKRDSLRARRRRSRSSDNRKSRSKSGDKEKLRTRRRRSRSSDNRKSRSKSADKRGSSVRARRRQSRSSDHKSRSRSVDKRETSVREKSRRSRSSDNRKSRSKSVDKRETSARAKSRRSRSSDNRKSRSKSIDKKETSARAKSRQSRSSDNRKSRSKSVDRKETSLRTRRRRSRSSDNHKSRSKSVDRKETSSRPKRKRSRSSDNCKSRSKSVDKIEVSTRSKRRRSKSSDHKSVTKSDEKRESSLKSRHRRSKSSDRQKSKSKSRSKSSERRKEKDSSDASKGNHSRSRSKSRSPEKIEEIETLEAPVDNHAKSPEHPKSKSRSRSKSLDKTGDRSNRSTSKCSEPKSHTSRTVSRTRRNRSRSLTRKRTSRSKSDHRSRSRSRTRSRSCSRRWRRTRSRSLSRQRSLSRERRRRSRRNRSRSVERRRRRSDSRDSYRLTLRLRSRSRTPVRLRTSRSAGRRRSPSVSPDHRRSRSSSRSPKRLTDLDKAQLLEIAKANAAAMCAKAGVPLPPSLLPVVTPEKKEEKVTQKSAKETIMELTEKCKKIAQSQEDDVILNKPHVSDEEEEEHPFINHPFKLSEPKPIFFNLTTPSIKPAPPKNQVTLTKEFPVSSGSQHRKKEADSAYGEWVPVEKNKEENKDDVFPNPATLEPVDISSALSERTIAQKRLTENTFDLEAMCLLNRAQERIDAWAQLNSLPGQFTGSTGAQVLSSEQLSNSGPQAWLKKVDDTQTDESKYEMLSSFEITGRSDNDTLRTLVAS